MRQFIILIAVICLLSLVIPAQAQVQLETALPSIPGQPLPNKGIPEYINYLFIFGLGLVAILALTQMMLGGLTYILAAGNVAKTEDAKDMVQQALLGMGLLLASYLLLRTINPDLVNLKAPNLVPNQFKGLTSGAISVAEWQNQVKINNPADIAAVNKDLQTLSKQENGARITNDLIHATKINGKILLCDKTGNNCTASELVP